MNIFADTIAADPHRAHSAGYAPPAPSPEPPAAAVPSAAAAAGEPGPAVQDGTPGSGPAAGPGDTVSPEEIEAEFGPALAASAIEVTVSPGTAPMAACHQPYEHGWEGPAGIRCDVPEHHEAAPAAEQAEAAPDAEPQP